VIVTVTLNPALQVDYAAQRVRLGAANSVSRVSYRAGGGGLTVARVLHSFGHEVVAAGLVGGAAGELIRAELSRSGIATQFTPIAMESRRAVRVADGPAGQVTTFDEPAPYITTEELGRLARDYRALMEGATAAVLCGSLPAGLPPEIYASLASYAAEAGVPAVLDADGSALWPAISRRPALVIPGPATADPEELIAGGAQAVVAKSDGIVRVVTEAGQWRAWLPARGQPAAVPVQPGVPVPVQPGVPVSVHPAAAVSVQPGVPASGQAGVPVSVQPAVPASGQAGVPVSGQPGAAGSGQPGAAAAGTDWPHDALVAGFVPGIALGWSWADILRHALALAASAQPAGEVDLSRYEELLPDVEVEPPAADWRTGGA
jgi:tagatose 6-phosphate kinase